MENRKDVTSSKIINRISAKKKIKIIIDSINGKNKDELSKKYKLEKSIITSILYSKYAKIIRQEYQKSLNSEILVKITNEMNAVPKLMSAYFKKLSNKKAIKALSDDEAMRNIGFLISKYKEFTDIVEQNNNIMIQNNNIVSNNNEQAVVNSEKTENILERFIDMSNGYKQDTIMLNNPNYKDESYDMIEADNTNINEEENA